MLGSWTPVAEGAVNGFGARLIVVALVTLAPSEAHARAATPAAETTVFTLAGAGDARAREGAAATDVRLGATRWRVFPMAASPPSTSAIARC